MNYTLTDFIKILKMDMGLRDLPTIATDEEMKERLRISALKDFSILKPRVVRFTLEEKDRYLQQWGMNTYRIPRTAHEDKSIIHVFNVSVRRPSGYSDYYSPMGTMYGADDIIGFISDMKMAASLQGAAAPALTFDFQAPDLLTIHNGWAGGYYYVTMGIEHDINLQTIDANDMISFKKLALLDMKEYFYNILKRKDSAELGVANIQLKIDDWQSAAQDKAELLKSWDEEGANLDYEYIQYY